MRKAEGTAQELEEEIKRSQQQYCHMLKATHEETADLVEEIYSLKHRNQRDEIVRVTQQLQAARAQIQQLESRLHASPPRATHLFRTLKALELDQAQLTLQH